MRCGGNYSGFLLGMRMRVEGLRDRRYRRKQSVCNARSRAMSKTFDSLIRDVVKTRVPHRLLCIFVETKEASTTTPHIFKSPPRTDEAASWIRVCTSAHMAVTPQLTFALLTETADSHDATWSSVIVAACHNSDRTMPSERDADVYLANMRRRLLEGDRAGFVEFDRRGRAVAWEEMGRTMKAAAAL